ncbi:MAG TPA: DUF3653 domain-containing protein [Gammaproteobacteria bacterium]|nr:DUF3653 domain-containing protein [Gammaproteobacteria bacterium]
MDAATTYHAAAGSLSADCIAQHLAVSARTVRHWRAQGRAPAWAVEKLLELHTGRPLNAVGWDGWRLWKGQLWSPEGDGFHPADLRASHYWRALARELIRSRLSGAVDAASSSP